MRLYARTLCSSVRNLAVLTPSGRTKYAAIPTKMVYIIREKQVSLRLEIWSNNNQLTKSPSITKIQRHELNPPRVPISAIPRARRPPKAPDSEAAV